MATDTALWPEEMTYSPTPEELEAERRYWQDLDRIAEYEAWIELRAEKPGNFEGWTAEELADELEAVRTLTPDRDDVIDALVEALRSLKCVEVGA